MFTSEELRALRCKAAELAAEKLSASYEVRADAAPRLSRTEMQLTCCLCRVQASIATAEPEALQGERAFPTSTSGHI